MEYQKCLVQLDEVLKHLSESDLEKIPSYIIESIKERKDKEYDWVYDENKKLNEQNLDRQTITMLSYINLQYLLNDEQREIMENIHKCNEKKQEKRKKYNSVLLKKEISENQKMILEKENTIISTEIKKNNLFSIVREFFKTFFVNN